MSNHVDEMIAAAIRNGELDDLPYKGQPLPLDDDGHVPEELRMAHRVLKNSGYVPGEVTAMQEVAALRAQLAEAPDPTSEASLLRRIREKQAWIGARLERIRGM